MRRSRYLYAVFIPAVGVFAVAARAGNQPVCPFALGWNGTLQTWASTAPWIKILWKADIPAAKSIGCKVFYRPYDIPGRDDFDLPDNVTGTQMANQVLAVLNTLPSKSVWPDAVGYRNEWEGGGHTALEFINYYDGLRAGGYTGIIVYGSYATGAPDMFEWARTEVRPAIEKADAVETHEYFDLTVKYYDSYTSHRHVRSMNAYPYLRNKPWFIGEFGSDASPYDAREDPCLRVGWRDTRNCGTPKLTPDEYITQIGIYRAGDAANGVLACADNVVAVFLFADGSPDWRNFAVLGTPVADYLATTWTRTRGSISGTVKDSSNKPIAGATVRTDLGSHAGPGPFSTTTAADGSFSLYADPWTYTVIAGKSGYDPAQKSPIYVLYATATPCNFVLQPAPIGTNLALNAVTYLECGHTNASEIGLFARDGNATGTKWACKHNGNAVPGDHALAFDLGSHAMVAQYYLKNASWLGEPSGSVGTWDTRNFVIESGPSLNGPWTQEVSVTNNTLGTYSFVYSAPKALRYVRLRVTQPTQDNSNWAVRVPEFEVRGDPAAAEPIRFEAEDYDSGANAAEGTDYHDTTAGNSGGQYRNQNVDIESCSEGGFDVIADVGEWLRYRLKTSGPSTLSIRHAGTAASTCHLEIDGGDVTGPLALPATGGNQTWQTFAGPQFTLASGDHLLRLIIDTGSHRLNAFTLSPPGGAPPGDWDNDGDVDQSDFGRFQACLTGVGIEQPDPECAKARLDGDNDVDLNDEAVFMGCVSGPGNPANPACAG